MGAAHMSPTSSMLAFVGSFAAPLDSRLAWRLFLDFVVHDGLVKLYSRECRILLLLRGSVMDFEIIKRLLAALGREHVRYAIFGAVAMNLHGLARFTEELDLFVEPEANNIKRLKAALRVVIDDPEIDNITAQDLLGEYPAVQYVPPDGAFHVDILTRLGEAFSFAEPCTK